MFNLTVDTAHTFYVGANGWLVHNVKTPSKIPEPQLPQFLKVIRSGGEVYVQTYEQARQILGAMENSGELSPYNELNKLPNPTGRSGGGFGQPRGTYRGDLINKENPTSAVHPDNNNIVHSNMPHYNIKLADGNKSYIVIADGLSAPGTGESTKAKVVEIINTLIKRGIICD